MGSRNFLTIVTNALKISVNT